MAYPFNFIVHIVYINQNNNSTNQNQEKTINEQNYPDVTGESDNSQEMFTLSIVNNIFFLDFI